MDDIADGNPFSFEDLLRRREEFVQSIIEWKMSGRAYCGPVVSWGIDRRSLVIRVGWVKVYVKGTWTVNQPDGLFLVFRRSEIALRNVHGIISVRDYEDGKEKGFNEYRVHPRKSWSTKILLGPEQ